MKRFLLSVCASVVCAALTGQTIRGQSPAVPTIPFEGTEIVCHILHSLGLEPVQKIQSDQLSPKNTIVIVFGRPAILDTIFPGPKALEKFRKREGSLFVASDYLIDRVDLPIHIAGGAKLCDVKYGYREISACPQLTPPWRLGSDQSSGHPVFRFLRQGIATNRPSHLGVRNNSSSLRILAEFPPYNQPRAPFDNGYIAGSAAGAPPTDRTLFIAGNGMFVNGMMVQKDNDNFAFTVNALRWLREGPDGKRTRALFVVDGTIVKKFDVNLYPTPAIPMPSARMINRLLLGLLKEWVGGEIQHVEAILIAMATLLLLIYAAKKMMEGRYFPDTHVPRFAGVQPTTVPPEPLVRLRQQTLMSHNQFGEAACALLREWFRAEFGIAAEKWADTTAIRFVVKGWRWRAGALRSTADRVLRVASAKEPLKVTRRELISLVQSLSALRRALEADRLALVVDGKKVWNAERRNAHE